MMSLPSYAFLTLTKENYGGPYTSLDLRGLQGNSGLTHSAWLPSCRPLFRFAERACDESGSESKSVIVWRAGAERERCGSQLAAQLSAEDPSILPQ